MKLLVITAIAVSVSAIAEAQPLSLAQLQTLKNSIVAASDPVTAAGGADCSGFVGVQINALPNAAQPNACIASMYNLTQSPAFTVWKTNVAKTAVGQTFNATEFAGLTTANTSRLSALSDWTDFVNPSIASVRQFFDDIFSGAGGVNTRAALLVLWKRLASRFERLYATGTGSDPSPATLVIEGAVTAGTVETARNLP